jgi:hypothetical protein
MGVGNIVGIIGLVVSTYIIKKDRGFSTFKAAWFIVLFLAIFLSSFGLVFLILSSLLP